MYESGDTAVESCKDVNLLPIELDTGIHAWIRLAVRKRRVAIFMFSVLAVSTEDRE